MKSAYVVILALVLVVSACGPPKLTREKAEDLIKNSEEFAKIRWEIRFHNTGLQMGVEQEMWEEVSVNTFRRDLHLTARGRELRV